MTFKLALIGHPVKHSASPGIHKQFLGQTGLKGSYNLLEIPPEQFETETLTQLKNEQWNGFNVTVPYKQKILPYLDHIDAAAERIGAVNTIVQLNGKWTGYNTDGEGFIEALNHSFPVQMANRDLQILLIGAGGATRAIYDTLVQNGYRFIDVANRTTETAKSLVNQLSKPHTETVCKTLQEAESVLDHYDVIVQTTSVGMKPASDRAVISLERIKPSAIVSDIVYQPIETSLLRQARLHGANVHYGHQMLLYQAKHAFKLWTGQTPEVTDLAQKMYLELEGG
ncbi:Shikimate dehydrogenase [Lentibacillus sp. JNUCC-1]|uniref:shikimate dehydrogenase n=1 Tax=Lentibacillus sp. JNUCC-1 TaxID=2654513 RepID=UPI0012E8DD56|nr:shikimate dehydrogenase [Lentibacillus sp. JNUCC-1]MUV39565.1 Shikimate dehydrogenase [Lentibacillus sp. JNUCC-1]